MNRESRAVSPVIAVILMVAVTVVMSAAIGAFVFDLGQSTTDAKQQSLGVSTTQTSTGLEVTVVTGEADSLRILVNGEPATTIETPNPGDSTSLTAQKGDDVTIVSERDGDEKVISTTAISITPSFNEGLVTHYRFGSGDRTTAYDTAGEYDGTINGATWMSSGQNDEEILSFDGTNDYVSIGTSVPELQSHTLSFWVYIENETTRGTVIAYQQSDANGNGMQILWEPANPSWRYHFWDSTGSAHHVDGGTPKTGSWTHIVGSYDGSTLRLYQDGTKVGEKAISASIGYGSDPFELGRRPVDNDRYLNGSLGDVRVYNRTLSGQEVAKLYNATK